MKMRRFAAPLLICMIGLALVACSSDPSATKSPGTLAMYEASSSVFPMPNDLTWASNGGYVGFPPDDGDSPEMAGLKWVVNDMKLRGLSPNMYLTLPFFGQVDPDTFEVLVLDITNPAAPFPAKFQNVDLGMGLMVDFVVEDEEDGDGATTDTIKLLPKTPFADGARYAVFLRGAESVKGAMVKPSAGMAALLGEESLEDSALAQLEPVRQGYDQLLNGIAPMGWPREEVQMMWTFTTADETIDVVVPGVPPMYTTLPVMAYDAFNGGLKSMSENFPEEEELPPMDRLTESMSIGSGIPASVVMAGLPNDNCAYVFFGSYDTYNLMEDDLETVPFMIVTPQVVLPENPVVLFQHGLGGDKTNALAIANSFAAAGFITVAIDAPLHGDRNEGESGDGYFTLNMIASRYNVYQSAFDLWEMMDLIEDGITLYEPMGPPVQTSGIAPQGSMWTLDADNVQFASLSLGCIIGSPFLNQEERINRMYLASPTAGMMNLLDETDISSLGDMVTGLGYTKGTTEYYIFLNLAQWLMDPVDGSYMGIGEKNIYNLIGAKANDDPTVPDTASDVFMAGVWRNWGKQLPTSSVDLDSVDFPTANDLKPGLFAFGQSGGADVPIVHSFLLSPSVDSYPPEYDAALNMAATVGAQTQATEFFYIYMER